MVLAGYWTAHAVFVKSTNSAAQRRNTLSIKNPPEAKRYPTAEKKEEEMIFTCISPSPGPGTHRSAVGSSQPGEQATCPPSGSLYRTILTKTSP